LHKRAGSKITTIILLIFILLTTSQAFATTIKIPDSNTQATIYHTIGKIEETTKETENYSYKGAVTKTVIGPEIQSNSNTRSIPEDIAKEIENMPPGTTGSWEITTSDANASSKPSIQTAIQSWGGQISIISKPKGTQAPSIAVKPNTLEEIPSKEEIRKAMQGTKIEITEYCNYSNSRCRSHFYTTFQDIMEEYGDLITYKFIFFQTNSLEGDLLTAQAAKCAEEQNKFFEMHEKIFEIEQPFTKSKIKNMAAQTSLDTETFNQCLESQKFLQEIQAKQQKAKGQGVWKLPTFFANDIKVGGYRTRQFEEAFIKIMPEQETKTETQTIKVCASQSEECAQVQKISVESTTQAGQAQPIEIEYGTEQVKQKSRFQKMVTQ